MELQHQADSMVIVEGEEEEMERKRGEKEQWHKQKDFDAV